MEAFLAALPSPVSRVLRVLRDALLGAPAVAALRVVTWNIAAVNNNPFEYWITHPDEAYTKLMGDVQAFIDSPGAADVPVGEVFTPQMFAELKAALLKTGWSGVEDVAAVWESDFKQREIVSGFLKDKSIGSKRLASMPDRITNTIGTSGGLAFRPTVINMYTDRMDSIDAWFEQWMSFVFHDEVSVPGKDGKVGAPKKVYELLTPIKRAKYPDVTEDEERISLPLQLLCLAIFDAIMVHMMNVNAPGVWHDLKLSLASALFRNKSARTVEILAKEYGSADVVCLQECSGAFLSELKGSSLMRTHFVCVPEKFDSKRDQNSLVLARKSVFNESTAAELTGRVEGALQGESGKPTCPLESGDLALFTFEARNRSKYLVASFHGDTNGLASQPVTDAIQWCKSHIGGSTLIVGIDANTYTKGATGKKAGVAEYVQYLNGCSLATNWGEGGPPKGSYTTFNARTYLQPQLNKAVKKEDIATSGNTDLNPKDFIIFEAAKFECTESKVDNTGDGTFAQNTPFPTLAFPSDHAALSAVLTAK